MSPSSKKKKVSKLDSSGLFSHSLQNQISQHIIENDKILYRRGLNEPSSCKTVAFNSSNGRQKSESALPTSGRGDELHLSMLEIPNSSINL